MLAQTSFPRPPRLIGRGPPLDGRTFSSASEFVGGDETFAGHSLQNLRRDDSQGLPGRRAEGESRQSIETSWIATSQRVETVNALGRKHRFIVPGRGQLMS